ncbi:hypothetical protein Hanom_Chr14g01320361 [Helianthus anomalus]
MKYIDIEGHDLQIFKGRILDYLFHSVITRYQKLPKILKQPKPYILMTLNEHIKIVNAKKKKSFWLAK